MKPQQSHGSVFDLEQQSPTFLAPETDFMEDSFSMDWGWFQDDSRTLHL